jgi:AraC-like DNA-binding protein
VKGITIENFIILDKLERAKEMILSGSLTFTQIAVHLQYSSVSHLSSQFKRIIGLTPTEFRKSKLKEKMPKKRS